MPLTYPEKWKFGEFPYPMTSRAHQEFSKLIDAIVEGVEDQQSIFEDFKSAFGNPNGSSNASWARSDMDDSIRSLTGNAARYVAAFYSGMEAVKKRKIGVPPLTTLNRILAANDIPLIIDPPLLRLADGDIELVSEEEAEEALAVGLVRGPEIGRGSFGGVYRVTRRTKLGEYHLAMKVLEPSVFIENKERANKRFIRELRTLEKLQHRAIITLLEAGMTAEQVPYILMPFIEGRNVRDALSGQEPNVIYATFIEIARGLDFAHRHGAIHRDLKPSNIIVRKADGQPFILDFGCAYLLDEVDDKLTTTLIGTPGYVPREVHDDPKHRDQRQDLYAIGVMLYEVIMSHRPVVDKYEPVEKVFKQFSGVDAVIRGLLAPEHMRVTDANSLVEMLSSL